MYLSFFSVSFLLFLLRFSHILFCYGMTCWLCSKFLMVWLACVVLRLFKLAWFLLKLWWIGLLDFFFVLDGFWDLDVVSGWCGGLMSFAWNFLSSWCWLLVWLAGYMLTWLADEFGFKSSKFPMLLLNVLLAGSKFLVLWLVVVIGLKFFQFLMLWLGGIFLSFNCCSWMFQVPGWVVWRCKLGNLLSSRFGVMLFGLLIFFLSSMLGGRYFKHFIFHWVGS